jgi:hypothetical protein
MHRAAAALKRFVEPTPKRHRAKACAHDMGMLAAAAIETALERHTGRGIVVSFGL